MQCQDTFVIDNCVNVDKFLNCITCDSKSIVDIRFYGEVFNYKLPIFSNLKHIYIRSKDVDISQFIEDYHENLYISSPEYECNKFKLNSICGLNKINKLNRLWIKGVTFNLLDIIANKDISNVYINDNEWDWTICNAYLNTQIDDTKEIDEYYYINAQDDMRHINKIREIVINITNSNSKVVYNAEETGYFFDILHSFKGYLNEIIGTIVFENYAIYSCMDCGEYYEFTNMDFAYLDNLMPLKQESLLVFDTKFRNCKNIDKITPYFIIN